ncbi:hypothetical protein Tco_0681770 [Tanacetum coccineum]|uniref:Uncharacterized protein n=1 Tax=Tanacetum coccineum TaxID=301880 RepID=A0ABQ4XQ76_9ASTR
MISGAEIDGELTEKEAKQVEADDQSIQTILMGLPEDIYVAVDSCNTAKEICQKQTYSGENIKQSQVSQQSTAIMEAICPSCSSNEESARSGLQPVVRFLETESGGDQPSYITYLQPPQPNSNYVQQPPFNTNYMQQPMQNPDEITDPSLVILH